MATCEQLGRLEIKSGVLADVGSAHRVFSLSCSNLVVFLEQGDIELRLAALVYEFGAYDCDDLGIRARLRIG